jgi:t-SNARE complex subunit (syntaxin)
MFGSELNLNVDGDS